MLILATQVNICTNMIIQHLNKMKKFRLSSKQHYTSDFLDKHFF